MLPLPAEWDPQPRDESGKEEVLHLVSLTQDTQEYKTVQKMFNQSLRGKASITSIERIQNPSMFHSYMLRKQAMDEKNGTLENELQLFHGTKPDSVKSINVQGFNRSLCGIYGTYRQQCLVKMLYLCDKHKLNYKRKQKFVCATAPVYSTFSYSLSRRRTQSLHSF